MNYARTYRSLTEAFGPYNGSSECEVVPLPAGPMDWQDKVVVTACAVAAVGFVCLLALGWIV